MVDRLRDWWQGSQDAGKSLGPANRIAVISRDVLLWEVKCESISRPDDVLIELPEPGSIAIHSDLPGKPEWHNVRLELRTYDGLDWEPDGLRVSVRTKNPGRGSFGHFPPAKYAVERLNETPIPSARTILMTDCDRQLVQIESGKQATVRFEHKIGRPLKGLVRGLENVALSDARLTIRYAGPEEQPGRNGRRARFFTGFDVVPVESDGHFSTDPMPPGDYDLYLDAIRSPYSIRMSDFNAQLRVSIPEKGEMPSVEIVAKPRAP
jgi:hypothetical protein